MGDSVDRLKAIDAIDGALLDEVNEGIAIDILLDLPSVQPEIIRCKECRYYEWMNNRVPAEQTWFCHNWNAETGKDDYCSYAERQEE